MQQRLRETGVRVIEKIIDFDENLTGNFSSGLFANQDYYQITRRVIARFKKDNSTDENQTRNTVLF